MIHLWPLILYAASAMAVVAGMLLLSAVLGERHREGATGETYESGIVSTGTACIRVDVKFYLMAMFFVIFDLEAVFIFSWAISMKEVGWPGYIEILVFIAILIAALAYLWKKGALDWNVGKYRRRNVR